MSIDEIKENKNKLSQRIKEFLSNSKRTIKDSLAVLLVLGLTISGIIIYPYIVPEPIKPDLKNQYHFEIINTKYDFINNSVAQLYSLNENYTDVLDPNQRELEMLFVLENKSSFEFTLEDDWEEYFVIVSPLEIESDNITFKYLPAIHIFENRWSSNNRKMRCSQNLNNLTFTSTLHSSITYPDNSSSKRYDCNFNLNGAEIDIRTDEINTLTLRMVCNSSNQNLIDFTNPLSKWWKGHIDVKQIIIMSNVSAFNNVEITLDSYNASISSLIENVDNSISFVNTSISSLIKSSIPQDSVQVSYIDFVLEHIDSFDDSFLIEIPDELNFSHFEMCFEIYEHLELITVGY